MDRHYGMDWLRIGAFALLILYHIGMFFVPWGWHVKTAQPLDWVAVPMLAANAWRLPLLFVVAGYASAALYGKESVAAFVTSRAARLLIPLVFAMILLIPVQPWIELMFKHGYAGSFARFWTRDYFRFEAIDGIVVPTWQHLWFVVYLWVYTMLVVGIIAVTPARAQESFARFMDDLLSGPGLLIVPIAWLAVHMAISGPDAKETHALVDDMVAHRMYFPAFVFGFFLRDAPGTWAAIRRWWKVAAILALLGYGVVAGIEMAWPGDTRAPAEWAMLFRAARLMQGWCAVLALIGIADRYWNRDHKWRPMLTEAVFPFYIIHQSIIVLAGWWLLSFALSPGAEFVILVAATVAGCWAFYLIGREITFLRPLIGLRLARPGRSAKAAAQPVGVP
ncbi:acyltransferase family protein [Sphingomonas sp. G-3-2-10]|uniref:acyltransferase family protein n=1 Tax=Sphingomonas sp. G-3-2-10 TaxID=2728838 RepID=UPI00146F6BD3|nr:acyltransferase family protein [Sphingomonas sp. G-3-2-10]NML06998.1 acyltransferase family protein [Sphingomonas sp. G-3-2-10]